MSYGKLFSSTFTGSMAGSGPVVFAVWSYVVSHVYDSQVELNPLLLAAIIGTEKKNVEEAIAFLCKPDPMSRNKAHDGARLVPEGQFAYFVVSYEIYHRMRDEDERREYNRMKKREEREKKSASSAKSTMSMTVNDKSALSANADADADADADAKGECIPLKPLLGSANQKSDGGQGSVPPNGQETLPAFAGTGATLLTFAIEPQVPPEKKTRAKRAPREFSAPSVEEVLLAASKAGLPDDQARLFHAHYSMTEWTYGSGNKREPLKSWAHALGKWAAKWKCDGGRFGNGKPSKPRDNNSYVPCQDEYKEGGVVFEQMRANSAKYQAEMDAEIEAERAAAKAKTETLNP